MTITFNPDAPTSTSTIIASCKFLYTYCFENAPPDSPFRRYGTARCHTSIPCCGVGVSLEVRRAGAGCPSPRTPSFEIIHPDRSWIVV
eukprot:m.62415 g.62415  ORF g.62415 m.62415 type:complete len:88 (-) comp17678_c0_seq1:944-1207(-)